MDKRVYFMHIAKAAGSSINKMIASQYLPGEVVTHFELYPERKDELPSKKFISGHPFFYIAKQWLPNIDSYYKITVFRNPVEHIVSHIAWVRRLADVRNYFYFRKHDKHFQDMAIKLKKMDLSSPHELRNFSNNLSQNERMIFDNFQARYLCNKLPGNIVNSDYEDMKLVLNEFDLIGTTDSLDVFLQQLFSEMGWTPSETMLRENTAKKYYGLDSKDPAHVEALRPLIEHDLKLYDVILNNYRINGAE